MFYIYDIHMKTISKMFPTQSQRSNVVFILLWILFVLFLLLTVKFSKNVFAIGFWTIAFLSGIAAIIISIWKIIEWISYGD